MDVTQISKRSDFITYLDEVKATTGAEIGVFTGKFSEALLKGLPSLKTLLAIDPWWNEGSPGYPDAYPPKITGATHIQAALNRLSPFGDRAVMIRAKSCDVARFIADSSLDFVHIDADHSYEQVMQDITNWIGKLKPGGLIFGHDAYERHGGGVIKATKEYAAAHRLEVRYTTDFPHPSWYFLPVNHWRI